MNVRQGHTAIVRDKKGRILAVGFNSYHKTHPLMARYSARTTNPCRIYIHAELDALLKARRRGVIHSLHVVRMDKRGNEMLSKPCPSCQVAIKDFKVKVVTWSE